MSVKILSAACAGEIAQWTIHNDGGTWTLRLDLSDGTHIEFSAAAAAHLHEASGDLVKAQERSRVADERHAAELAEWKERFLPPPEGAQHG